MSKPNVLEAIKQSVASEILFSNDINAAHKELAGRIADAEMSALDCMLVLAKHNLTQMDIKQYLTCFEEAKINNGQATKDSVKSQKNQRKLILEFFSGFKVGADGRMYEASKAMDFIIANQEEKAGVSAMAGAIRKELKGEEQDKPVDLDKLAEAFVKKMTENACTMTKAIELIKKQYNSSK